MVQQNGGRTGKLRFTQKTVIKTEVMVEQGRNNDVQILY